MKDTDTAYWSHLISELRKKTAWTQEALAELLQTDQATLSRWECGHAEPRSRLIRERLELLARDAKLCNLEDTIHFVQFSPFPMILVDQYGVIVAASASSGFQEGKTCYEQTPIEERESLRAFNKKLDGLGFWQGKAPRMDYQFDAGAGSRGAIVTRLIFWGAVYALVQKNW